MNTKKLVLLGVLTGIALILFTVENALPPIVPIVGVKLGLANTVTLLILFLGKDWRASDAALVLSARILLSALIVGQPMTLLFSAVGGTLSFLSMLLFKRVFRERLLPVVSVIGAFAHNIGQIAAAVIVYQSLSLLLYLPPLLLFGIVGGLLNGFIAVLCIRLQGKIFRKIG